MTAAPRPIEVDVRGIRSKILIITIGGLLFTGVISTLAVNTITRASLEAQTITRVEEELEYVEDLLIEPILTDDRLALQENVRRTVEGHPDVQYLYVLSADGEVLASSFVGGVPRDILAANPVPADGRTSVQVLATERGRILDIGRGILGGQVGSIHMGVAEATIAQVVEETVNILLFIQAGSLALAILASFILADILVRPIARLVDVVKRVGEGDLSLKTGVTSRDETGELARAFDAMMDELVRSQQALRDMAAHAQGIVSSFPTALLVTDATGRIRVVNPVAQTLTGFSEGDLVLKRLQDLFVSGPAKTPFSDFSPLLKRDGVTRSYAMHLLAGDGKVLPVAFGSAPVVGPDGQFRGYVVELRNLERLRQAIEGLKQQTALLQESAADSSHAPPPGAAPALPVEEAHLVRSDRLISLGQLAASVAHEINNPIFAIITCARVLERDLLGDGGGPIDRERLLKAARTIVGEATRSSGILRSFLDYARVGSPGTDVVSVNTVLEEVRALIAPKAVDQGVEIVATLGTPDEVKADAQQLHQVFLNVELNAIQAMPKGGRLTVRTEADAAKGVIEVAIADTGTGIAPEHLERVFEPFFTTKEKGVGTGLGLSIARGIITRHGGTIRVASEVGKGTEVRVTLPLFGAAGGTSGPPGGANGAMR